MTKKMRPMKIGWIGLKGRDWMIDDELRFLVTISCASSNARALKLLDAPATSILSVDVVAVVELLVVRIVVKNFELKYSSFLCDLIAMLLSSWSSSRSGRIGFI